MVVIHNKHKRKGEKQMNQINVETLKRHGTFVGLIEAIGYVYHMAGSYYSFSKNGINKINL